MAKTVTFEHESRAFTFEFTRETVKKLYKAGFYPGLLEKDPIEAVELLVHGAFMKHHPYIKRPEAVRIVSDLSESEDEANSLAAVLMDMVAEAMDETILKKTGKTAWQVNS